MDVMNKPATISFDTENGRIILGFRGKGRAEEFLQRMRAIAYKIDVVSMNDILREIGEKTVVGGGEWGFTRAEIRKIRPKNEGIRWFVHFPAAGRMIRDENGYWTTTHALKDAEGV